MIEVEKVNGRKVYINPDLVKIIEATPDTVVTFLSGEKILLSTPPAVIVERIIEYKKQIGGGLPRIEMPEPEIEN